MRGIGRLARESGLTVSALRFYDGAGVLVPARVDPQSNYRWYSDEQVLVARLVARLRRVGMPLAEISRVVEHRDDAAVVDALLQAHLTRLEDGLADARRELSAARSLLAPESSVTSIRTTTAALLDAARAVRFAVGPDAALPMLTGVLLDVADDAVRLVASDRYRLAVRTLAADVDGPPVSAILPIDLVDELLGTTATGPAAMRVAGGDVAVELPGRTLRGRRVDADFPDYRRLLRGSGSAQVEIDVARFRDELAAAPTRTVRRPEDGVEETAMVLTFGAVEVGVNRDYLLEALDAEDAGQLVLDLDGPIAPLVLRGAGRDGDLSMLMPIRLD
ncbi:DNA polymerase III subunit beta family protein [Blastococcus sp. VKM Ac-2987]|uniref:DNA polymerase III subunit beta family protein n=1 Tax=Blastococcus sp. VKM Ac-2987 TaxID=3004141 RepID=UPI0022AB767D|nr:MerR family transcriptional regulator [Blastococcus sp. VKM Ac-2987]MCZ2859031.1 MerR family transcriptional regulator [Blastococcus sp. VKM Ac-2987]